MASRKGGKYYDEDDYYDGEDDYYDDYDYDYEDEDDGYGDYDAYAVGGKKKGASGQHTSQHNAGSRTSTTQSTMARGICAKTGGNKSSKKKEKEQKEGAGKMYPVVPERGGEAVTSFQFDTPPPDEKKTQFQRASAATSSLEGERESNNAGVGNGNAAERGKEAAKKGRKAVKDPEADAKALSECLKDLETLEAGGAKSNILLVVLGHVDAGKSTLMGRLLADLGLFGEKEVRKRAHQASQIGKASFGWAWLMDERPEERERGVTIDIAKRIFETSERQVTILDAPGHRDFVPNAISGISQADAALLVIDGSTGGFESGFEKRGKISGQTREHAQLAKGIGIEQIAVVVTKLDRSESGQERFSEIRGKLEPFLKSCGFRTGNIQWLAASGITGDNVVSSPAKEACLGWFEGPTVVDAINNFTLVEHSREKPLRIPIFSVSNTKQGGSGNVVVTGRVTSGFLRLNAEVCVMYGDIKTVVKGIVRNNQKATFALAGDAVELTLTHEDSSCFEIGSVICSQSDPIAVSDKIQVKIITLELSIPFTLGQNIAVHCHAALAPGKITKMLSLHDPKTGEVIKKRPRLLKSFQTATVEVSLSKEICVENYADYPSLGRLVLRLGGSTVGVGKITRVC